jgi:hypothetical protein
LEINKSIIQGKNSLKVSLDSLRQAKHEKCTTALTSEYSLKTIKAGKNKGQTSKLSTDQLTEYIKIQKLATDEVSGQNNQSDDESDVSEGDKKEDNPLDDENNLLKQKALFKNIKDSIEFEYGLIHDAYIITDRVQNSDTSKMKILGFVGIKRIHFEKDKDIKLDKVELCYNVKEQEHIEIFLHDDLEMKNIWVDSSGVIIPNKTLYNYLENSVKQKEAVNITANAQGITSDIEFLPKKFGVTKAVAEDNIQQYLRITDGQPLDYKNDDELTVGIFDLIRYRHYGKLLTRNNPEDERDPDSVIYNQYLPLFGAEIRYGLPEINYPSLWSERMTLNVMWQSNKLGIILPTNGWSNLSTSFFNQQRRLTNAGIGLYGSFDVPIKLINQGGVFNFNASYVFGDAKPNPINTSLTFFGRTANQLTDSNSYRNYEISYLPRFHAQAHYSFAINIDKYSFFRFKLGATAYMMQRFSELAKFAGKDSKTGKDIVETKNRLIDQYSYNDLSIYNKYDGLAIAGLSGLNATETIAGLSGRIEFMTNTEEQTVPWGGALQYFDGSLSGDMWIQVPVYGFSKTTKIVQAVTDSTASADASASTTDASANPFALSLRAQAQFYQTIFRDPRPWELQTVVIPSLQILMNF